MGQFPDNLFISRSVSLMSRIPQDTNLLYRCYALSICGEASLECRQIPEII